MEDSVGTIFYIIIMVIVLAASILKKKKGKVQKPATVSGTSSDEPHSKPSAGQKIESLLSGFLKDQFPETAQKEDFPEIYEEEVKEPVIEKHVKPVEPIQVKHEEGQSVFAYDDPTTPKIETGIYKNLETSKYHIDHDSVHSSVYEDSIEENEIGKIVEEFDLKKAIIYSEILNPKYFKIQE